MKATINDVVIAESDDVEEVDGFIYFPRETVNTEYFTDSDKEYSDADKGDAEFYNFEDGDVQIRNVGWSYQDPGPEYEHIAGYIAFDKGKVRTEN